MISSYSTQAEVISIEDLTPQIIQALNSEEFSFKSEGYILDPNSIRLSWSENPIFSLFFEGMGSLVHDKDFYELHADFYKENKKWRLNSIIEVYMRGLNSNSDLDYRIGSVQGASKFTRVPDGIKASYFNSSFYRHFSIKEK